MSPDLSNPSLQAARAFLAGQTLPHWCDPQKLVLALHIDEASPSNNVIKGQHFHEYRKTRKGFAAKLAAALGHRQPPKLQQSALFVVRRSAGQLDWDNAIGGLKPILDSMVAPKSANPDGLHIVEDDKPSHMPFPPMMVQLPAKRSKGTTDIYVFAL